MAGEQRRRAAVATATAMAIIVSTLAWTPVEAAPPGLVARGPITIEGRESFTPQNGVTSGNGSAEDPYVIEGWDIDAGGHNGLYVYYYEGPAPHLIVRNLRIHNASAVPDPYHQGSMCCTWAISALTDGAIVDNVTIEDAQSGIKLDGTDRVTIQGSRFTNVSGDSLSLDGATGTIVSGNSFASDITLGGGTLNIDAVRSLVVAPDNTVRGAPLEYLLERDGAVVANATIGQVIVISSHNVSLVNLTGPSGRAAVTFYNSTDARLNGSALGPVYASFTERLRIENTTIRSEVAAAMMVDVNDVTFANNTIVEAARGLDIYRAVGLEIVDNHIDAPGDYPASLSACSEVRILRNSMSHGASGTGIHYSWNISIEGNDFHNNGFGLSVGSVYQVAINGNRVADNARGAITIGEVYLLSLTDNVVFANGTAGISFVSGVYGVTAAGNALVGGAFGFEGLWPDLPEHVDFGANNTIDGLPMRAYHDCEDGAVDGLPTGQLLVVNCSGFVASNLTIAGNQTLASFAYASGIVLEHSVFAGGEPAVQAFGVIGLSIVGNRISNCTTGMQVWGVQAMELRSNRMEGCGVGLYAGSILAGEIADNTIEGATVEAMDLDDTEGFRITGNNLSAAGLELTGRTAAAVANHEIDATNMVGGHPLLYFPNCTGPQPSVDGAGEVILANCHNASVTGGALAPGTAGMRIQLSRGVVVEGVNVSGAVQYGVRIARSENITLRGVDASQVRSTFVYEGSTYTVGIGVYVGQATTASVVNSTIRGSGYQGLGISSSSAARLEGTLIAGTNGTAVAANYCDQLDIVDSWLSDNEAAVTASGQNCGVRIAGSRLERNGMGIELSDLRDPVVEANTISDTAEAAIAVHGGSSAYVRGNAITGSAGPAVNFSHVDGGRIEENNLSGNAVGVSLQMSRNVVVLRNFFHQNTVQAFDNTAVNQWNGSAAEGGNYWSDYAGPDHCAGPAQDQCTGADGYGDAPVSVPVGPGPFSIAWPPYTSPAPAPHNGTDFFPLMAPVLRDPPPEETCTDCSEPGPGPWDAIRGALIAITAIVGLSAMWIALVRIRPRKPLMPPEGGA